MRLPVPNARRTGQGPAAFDAALFVPALPSRRTREPERLPSHRRSAIEPRRVLIDRCVSRVSPTVPKERTASPLLLTAAEPGANRVPKTLGTQFGSPVTRARTTVPLRGRL